MSVSTPDPFIVNTRPARSRETLKVRLTMSGPQTFITTTNVRLCPIGQQPIAGFTLFKQHVDGPIKVLVMRKLGERTEVELDDICLHYPEATQWAIRVLVEALSGEVGMAWRLDWTANRGSTTVAISSSSLWSLPRLAMVTKVTTAFQTALSGEILEIATED